MTTNAKSWKPPTVKVSSEYQKLLDKNKARQKRIAMRGIKNG